jgi:hypothetical protein
LLQVLGFPLLAALTIASFWIVPYLPTNDGPQWIFATHMENHYGDPGTLYSQYYVPAPQFASRGFTLLYGPLESWLGWQRGLQVALGAMVLLAAGGFVVLVRELDPRRWPLGFLGFPLALSWGLYMGVWAYVVAGGIGLGALAFAVRHREPTRIGLASLAALLTVQAVAHVFAASLTCVALVALALARSRNGKVSGDVGWMVLACVPVALILVVTALVSSETRTLGVAQNVQFTTLREMVTLFPQTLAPGPFGRALVATLSVVGAGALAARRSASRVAGAADRAFGVLSVLLLVAGAVAPLNVPGWQFFSQRFVALGAALACAVLPFELLPARLRAGCALGLFLLSAAYVALTYPLHQRLAAACSDAVAGLFAPVHRAGVTLPVVANPANDARGRAALREVPWLDPLLHLGELYAAAQGGITPYGFPDSAATYPFARRATPLGPPLPPAPSPDRYWALDGRLAFRADNAERHELEDELTAFGMFYGGVTLLGAQMADLRLWRARGYVSDWERGSTLLAHFEPCALDVVVSSPAAGANPAFDVVVAGLEVIKGRHGVSTTGADGKRSLQLRSMPCGSFELRPHWDPVEPGGPPAFCSNADARGLLAVTVTRDSGAVTCDAPTNGSPSGPR